MLTPRMLNIRDENTRLDEQLFKLRQCKAEMESMFDQLDNLEKQLSDQNDSDSYSDSDNAIYRSKSNRKKYLSKSMNYAKASKNNYNTTYDYDNDNNNSFSHSCSQSDCDENNENYVEKRIKETTVISYDSELDSYREKSRVEIDRIREKKPPKPPKPPYKAAKMQFSYRIPQNFSPLKFNSSLDLRQLAENATRYNNSRQGNNNLNELNKKKSKIKIPKPPTTVNPHPQLSFLRPTWKPNGKFKTKNNNFLEDLTMSKSRSSSTQSLNKSLNQKLAKPWKPTGKKRPDSAIFLSSTNLAKSTESLENDTKNVINKKDVGKDWRPVGYKKPDPGIYLSSQSLSETSTKPQKKQPFIDEKDVGQGWKPIGISKSKSNLNIPSSQPIIESKEAELPKKKVIIDEKDIGKGWKHVGKVKEELKIFTNPKLDEALVKDSQKEKKKSFKDEKDIGDGWKPVIKIKQETKLKTSVDVPKPPEIEKPKVTPVVAAKNLGKAWKPNGVSTKPPLMVTTNTPGKKLIKSKTIANTKNNDIVNKNIITSTPNISQDFEANKNVNDLLEESVIEKKSDVVSIKNRSKNDSNQSLKAKSNENSQIKNTSKPIEKSEPEIDLDKNIEDEKQEDEKLNESIKNSKNQVKLIEKNNQENEIESNRDDSIKNASENSKLQNVKDESMKNLSKNESKQIEDKIMKPETKKNDSLIKEKEVSIDNNNDKIEKPNDSVFGRIDSDNEEETIIPRPKINTSNEKQLLNKENKPKNDKSHQEIETPKNESKPSSDIKSAKKTEEEDEDENEEKQFWNMKSDEDD